jgi:hypothetical protein
MRRFRRSLSLTMGQTSIKWFVIVVVVFLFIPILRWGRWLGDKPKAAEEIRYA